MAYPIQNPAQRCKLFRSQTAGHGKEEFVEGKAACEGRVEDSCYWARKLYVTWLGRTCNNGLQPNR